MAAKSVLTAACEKPARRKRDEKMTVLFADSVPDFLSGAAVIDDIIGKEFFAGPARVGGLCMKWFYTNSGDSWYRMYFSFHGRLDRVTLWLRIVLLNIFVSLVMFTMSSLSTEYTHINYGSWLNCILVVYWWSLSTLWTRRCHDRGASGWWYGGFAVAVPLVFALNIWSNFHMEPSPIQDMLTKAGIGLFIVLGLYLIYLVARFGFTKSMPGANRYGPDPNARPVRKAQEAPKGRGKKPARRVKKVVVKKAAPKAEVKAPADAEKEDTK